jgi:uncharacterized protein YbaR (Trm112 family)
MFLKFQITCTCHNRYTVNESVSADKIICPNCGLEYPYSDKVLSILKTAKEIPEGNITSDKECCISVLSLGEETSGF